MTDGGVGVKCETDVTLVSQAPMSTPLRCTGKCVCASLCVYKKPHLREGFPWTPVLFRLISLRGKEMMASVKEEREGRDGGRSVCVCVCGGVTSIPLHLWKRRPHVGWTHSFIHSAHLFPAQWVYGYWKGVAVSPSFPEGVNISPSPSFLCLCLFFSNSIFSPKHQSPLHARARNAGRHLRRNKTLRHNAHTDRSVRLQNSVPTVIPEKLPLGMSFSTLSQLSIAAPRRHAYQCIFICLCSRLLWGSRDRLRPFYDADVC